MHRLSTWFIRWKRRIRNGDTDGMGDAGDTDGMGDTGSGPIEGDLEGNALPAMLNM